MKNKSSITLGPGASSLVLIFVVLSLAALGMLSLMTSRNDLSLAERSAQVIQAVYALNVRAEEKRAELDGLLKECTESATGEDAFSILETMLPEDVELEDGQLLFTVEDGTRMLDCALDVLSSGENPRMAWARYDLMAETEDDSWNW